MVLRVHRDGAWCSYTSRIEELFNGLISSKSIRSLMLGGVIRVADEGLEEAD